MKNMKKIWIAGIVVFLLAAASIGGIGIYKFQEGQKVVEPEENTEESEVKRVDPAEFEAEEIYYLYLFSYNEEREKMVDISLWMYPGAEEATINHEKMELDGEQVTELKELILQYSQTVKEQEDEYWPNTSEYPDMLVLFQFDMFGQDAKGKVKQYKTNGALCYPEGWEEFIEDLKEIIL